MNGSLPPANPSPAQKGGQKKHFWLRPLLVPGSEMENGKTPLRAVAPSLISVLEAKGRGCLLARVLFSASHRGPCWTASPPARAEPNFDRFSALGNERSFPVPPAAGKARAEPTQPTFRSLSRSPRSPPAAGAARGTHPARSRGSGAAAGPWPAARGPAAASPGAAARSRPSSVLVSR